jgi:hypothetical protein
MLGCTPAASLPHLFYRWTKLGSMPCVSWSYDQRTYIHRFLFSPDQAAALFGLNRSRTPPRSGRPRHEPAPPSARWRLRIVPRALHNSAAMPKDNNPTSMPGCSHGCAGMISSVGDEVNLCSAKNRSRVRSSSRANAFVRLAWPRRAKTTR